MAAGLEELKRRLRPLSFDVDGGGAAPAGGEVRDPPLRVLECAPRNGLGVRGRPDCRALKWRLLGAWWLVLLRRRGFAVFFSESFCCCWLAVAAIS